MKKFRFWKVFIPCVLVIFLFLGNFPLYGNAGQDKTTLTESRSINDSFVNSFDFQNPPVIRVYRKSLNRIETVPFFEYCQVVVSGELGAYANDFYFEAMKACALAIKMTAFYEVVYPNKIITEYDIRDDMPGRVYNP